MSMGHASFQTYGLPPPHLSLPCRSDRSREQLTAHEYMCTVKFSLFRPDHLRNVGRGATVHPTYGGADMVVPVPEYMSCRTHDWRV